MTDQVRDLLAAFDTLPPADKQMVVRELNLRLPPYGPVTDEELIASAEEMFLTLDAEESAHAARVQPR
jgi:hypothetical protein